MSVTYQVASSDGHYVAARNLMQQEGEAPVNLGFPTLLAFETDPPELIGILGTHFQEDLMIAGPLVMKSDVPVFARPKVAMRLCERYEYAARALGIKSFIFHVEDGTIFDQAFQRYNGWPGLEHYATEGNRKFYIRRL